MERMIEELLSRLTLEEKVGMIHGAGLFRTAGVERLEIPALYFSDGPMGVRAEFVDGEWRSVGNNDDFVSYLPCNSAVASTWNREIAKKCGAVLGEEARGRGKDVILAPGINIKRSPLCGRNFEYMSEDPYLIEELVVPMVQGIQEQDVAACVKHFAANSQETERLWVDTVVEEQALQEIYYPGFRAAVEKGGVYSLMGAYNRLQGEHCCTSRNLLNQVLREAWGFTGLVVSDWGGVHDTALAAGSGLDIEMDVTGDFDGHFLAQPLLEKIRAGEIPEAEVDEKVRNILRLMLRLKMIGPEKEQRSGGAYNTREHREAALAAAEESIVLLKNESGVLPLDPKNVKTVAVIGANAATTHSNGGGSAEIKALYEITPLMGIKMLLGGNVQVRYAPGYVVPRKDDGPEISWQADSTKQKADIALVQEWTADAAALEEAVTLARECDAVIFIGGLNHDFDLEGQDRQSMKLPYGQDAVIEALLEARPDTVVALYAGSPVEMPWVDRAKSLVWSYYAGMEGGTALAEVLFGRVNPSGKLAETFPKTLEQCPARLGETFGRKDRVVYEEGVMVGYRHYDTADADVNFCFGHGLSYTSFRYDCLRAEGDRVSLQVTNTGDRPGCEVVQLYVAPLEDSGHCRPVHQLRGFEKLCLAPGEAKTVTFTLMPRDFSCFDKAKGDFTEVPGQYEIQIGASSRDIRVTCQVCR